MTLRLPTVPNPRMEQNIAFAMIPDTGRKLLCDVWQPHSTIAPSGLAFIYLHGAAWYMLDKDLGTRPFFSHLAAQGHVIMDVAYRLSPETDMMGMVHDVKRAIVWMKENAATLWTKSKSNCCEWWFFRRTSCIARCIHFQQSTVYTKGT